MLRSKGGNRKHNLLWLNHKEIENLNRLITSQGNWNSNQKFPNRLSSVTTSLVNDIKCLKKNWEQFISTLTKIKENSKLILQGQYYPDIKARQEHYKERKL